MKRQLLICLASVLAAANAVGIFGGIDINPNEAEAQAGIKFPRIPGINAPSDSSSSSSSEPSGGSSGSSGRNGFFDLGSFGGLFRPSSSSSSSSSPPPSFDFPSSLPSLPDIAALIPELPNAENASSVSVPRISEPPSLSSLPPIPGLTEAIQEARNHLETALNSTGNFVDGIQKAIEQAFEGDDPTGAVRTLVNTILDAYLTVAENCPVIVIGVRVLREGIRLAGEVAKSARNVILGPSN